MGTPEKCDPNSKSFLGHLEDLRKTIVHSVIALVVGMAIALPLAPSIMRLLMHPLDGIDLGEGMTPAEFLMPLDAYTGVMVAVQIVVWGGLIISFPVIVYIVSRFVAPGLSIHERRVMRGSAACAAVLFGVGVAMCYFTTLSMAFQMMLNVNEWLGFVARGWRVDTYVSFVLKLLLAFGAAFELPVVVLAMGAMGIVNSRQLRNKRRHVIVGLMIMSMLLTPQDPGTMLLMAAPLCVLYEACIWILWAKERRKAEAQDKGRDKDE